MGILDFFGWRSPLQGVRYNAVFKLSSPERLRKLATSDKSARVRQRAVERLESVEKPSDFDFNSLLEEIATTDQHWSVRAAAVRQIEDPGVLATIAQDRDEEDSVRVYAVKKIDDAAILSRLALEDPEWRVRWNALARVGDQAVIAKAATTEARSDVREVAVGLLESKTLLARIAESDESEGIRRLALRRCGFRSSCRHLWVRVSKYGQTCVVCDKSIDPGMTSEERGQSCAHCGIGLHINCQKRFRSGSGE